ncbi:hypothetical protein ACFLRZ_01180 [Bacteroidota bacterium]
MKTQTIFKIVFILILLTLLSVRVHYVSAQNIYESKAQKYLEKAEINTDEHHIDKMLGKIKQANKKLHSAKENIDNAIKDPEIAKNSRAWYYHGLIYYYIGSNELFTNKSCDIASLSQSINSLEMALSLEKDPVRKVEILSNVKQVMAILSNYGCREFDKKKYKQAIRIFEEAVSANDIIIRNGWESMGLQLEFTSIFYACYLTEDYDKMLFYGNILIAKNYHDDEIYELIKNVYITKGLEYNQEDILAKAKEQVTSSEELIMKYVPAYH